ncbi:MAG: sugar transferase [Actinobacteria bacterium]|nr:MAG: sugar transferase [Actinomycetota bacterium]
MPEIGVENVFALPAIDEAPRTLTGIASARTLEILEHRRAARRPHRRGWLIRRMLLLADVAALAAAFFIAELLFGGGSGSANRFHSGLEYALLLATLPGWILLARLYGLYEQDEERTHHPTTDDVTRVFHLVTVGAWLLFAGEWLTGVAHPSLPKVIALWALAIALVTAARSGARFACRRSLAYLQNTIIVGAGDVGQNIARKLLRHPEYGINLVGFVDARPKARQDGLDHVMLLGGTGQLPGLVRMFDVERVVIAFSGDSSEETLEVVRSLNDLDVQVDIVPRLYELVSPSVKIDTLEGVPLIELPPPRLTRSSWQIKRTIDIIGALVALILTAPLFAYIAWRVKRDSPGPIFFRQTRLGQNQREFTALKFRTMKVDVDTSVHREYIERTMDPRVAPTVNGLYKLERDEAVTQSGRWLRRTSLDELPQLINVLRGDMSLVGPRPCIDYETEHFLPHHFDRFLVPAGITGLWQVTARAHATFKEALDMDVAYARGWSLGLDLRLLSRTPLQVLRRRATA